jgi:hypothetical protein
MIPIRWCRGGVRYCRWYPALAQLRHCPIRVCRSVRGLRRLQGVPARFQRVLDVDHLCNGATEAQVRDIIDTVFRFIDGQARRGGSAP